MLFSLALISQDIGVIGNVIILSTFILATPQLFISYQKYTALKDMEAKFPVFLRGLIENLRSGIAFHKAIITSSKIDYGKLSPEIKKVANQLTWGMPIDKVLNQLANRLKGSRRLYTSIKIIRESFVSGGDVVSTLDAVADNATLLQDSEQEKKTILDQYVVLMYAISIIFIVIVVVINRLLIPIFNVSGESLLGESIGLSNPCDSCTGISCNVCDMFQGTSQVYFSIKPGTTAAYYTSLFFYMALIQSLFSGLVAGQISENSIVAGMKHSLILVGITVGAFSILVKLKLMGV
ncbi:MAG: type II secretion system F family protein [Candidatus Aenigmarchaeota archaeon]|nr:type II secretion system F family protein [Candidatus Aenigmarchaeota archaeon]